TGVSWTRVLGSAQTGGAAETHDLVIDQTNPLILYAAVEGSGVWKTTNGGTSWSKLAGGLPTSGFGRIDLGIDPNNALRIFASFSAGSFLGTWRSTDGGTSWTQVA